MTAGWSAVIGEHNDIDSISIHTSALRSDRDSLCDFTIFSKRHLCFFLDRYREVVYSKNMYIILIAKEKGN